MVGGEGAALKIFDFLICDLMIFLRLQIFSFLLLCNTSNAQTVKEVDSISYKHEICLDAGVNMLKCSKQYYRILDSLLNLAYANSIKKLSIKGKATLKNNQLSWLVKRDNYFKGQDKLFDKEYSSGNWGSDMEMITIDKKAEFVKARVIYLINYKY